MAEIIEFNNVSFKYQANTPFEQEALKNVSFTIPKNKFTAIIGHTGSGKSTIMQLFNGLLLPTSGEITIDGYKLTNQTKAKNIVNLRHKVGFVFQFSEGQLFAETVLDDVMFGPLNFGLDKEEAKKRAKKALEQVGIDTNLYQRSPFELSGGQMRRVAIAGIIAIQPKILVLDEPTVGLDPKGRRQMMELFKELQKEGITVILVTHSMEDVASYADYVLAMEDGELLKTGTPKELFSDDKWLKKHHLALPEATIFAKKMFEMGLEIDDLPITAKQLADLIWQKLGGANS